MTSIAALNRVQGLINFKGLRRTLCTTQRAMAEQQHMGSDTAPQESKQAARKAIKAGLLKMPQDQMEAESRFSKQFAESVQMLATVKGCIPSP
mmetsp:Transcript_27524/g.74467  ORF Transcript_27524/g.74467 Transcript_27524/m.74467 type:complete len:93 (-) Transcript_27524:315-593(-)|eukprot:1162035-Pelagomonas_calceolata.AAC.6